MILLVVASVMAISATAGPVAQPDTALIAVSNEILRDLATLPGELIVEHSPNPVQGVRKPEGKYVWTYRTSVQPREVAVTIEEFGSFFWAVDQERWLLSCYTGKPFTAADFASWYSCPGAVISEGIACADSSNWSSSTCRPVPRSMWYYIGRDATGRRVKGEAIVEQLPPPVEAAGEAAPR